MIHKYIKQILRSNDIRKMFSFLFIIILCNSD